MIKEFIQKCIGHEYKRTAPLRPDVIEFYRKLELVVEQKKSPNCVKLVDHKGNKLGYVRKEDYYELVKGLSK